MLCALFRREFFGVGRYGFVTLRVRIPPEGTEKDDPKPPRIAPRHLFDFSVSTDNLLGGGHTKLTLRFTPTNITK